MTHREPFSALAFYTNFGFTTVQHYCGTKGRSSRVERLNVTVVTTKLKSATGRTTAQLRQVIRIFQTETVLRWHRQLVRRKWTHNPDGRRGRPKVDPELERLVVRFARENLD